MVSLNNTVQIHNVHNIGLLLQRPVKGATGLVIAAVSLNHILVKQAIDQTFNSNIHLIFHFWPPFCYKWHSLYNFKNNITTLTKITMVLS